MKAFSIYAKNESESKKRSLRGWGFGGLMEVMIL